MKKTDLVKTAPRVSETAAGFYRDKFDTLNAGIELTLEAFPVLHHRALYEILPGFEDRELCLIIDNLNGILLAPQLLGQHLLAGVADGIALNKLDQKWGVDKDALMEKLKTLTTFQAAALEIWCAGFWSGGHWQEKTVEDYIKETKP